MSGSRCHIVLGEISQSRSIHLASLSDFQQDRYGRCRSEIRKLDCTELFFVQLNVKHKDTALITVSEMC